MVNQAFTGARASGCIRANSISRFRVMMCTRLTLSQIEILVKRAMDGVRFDHGCDSGEGKEGSLGGAISLVA